ncbi:MAG: type II toxin-antitoxin system RelE/ParE family toxin [Terracidiphilus sp.]
MPNASFSGRAKADLLSIGSYSMRAWGEAQTARYLEDLRRCAMMLARNPKIGRSCDWIRPGLHRFEQGRHVVFYREVKGGILVVRILHQSMLPDKHSFEGGNPGA